MVSTRRSTSLQSSSALTGAEQSTADDATSGGSRRATTSRRRAASTAATSADTDVTPSRRSRRLASKTAVELEPVVEAEEEVTGAVGATPGSGKGSGCGKVGSPGSKRSPEAPVEMLEGRMGAEEGELDGGEDLEKEQEDCQAGGEEWEGEGDCGEGSGGDEEGELDGGDGNGEALLAGAGEEEEDAVGDGSSAEEEENDDDKDDEAEGEGEEGEEEEIEEDDQEEEESDDEEDTLKMLAKSMGAHFRQSAAKDAADGLDEGALEALRWRPQTHLPSGLTASEADGGSTEADIPLRPDGFQLHVAPFDQRKAAREEARRAPKTKGAAWFDLPQQTIDEDMKRELRLIRLRGAYDPKRFYKSFDTSKFPTYFQVGTVVNGPADFYAGSLTKAEAKNQSVTQQVLADQQIHQYRKKRYNRMQEESTRWSSRKKAKQDGKGGEGSARVKRRGPKPKH